MSRIEKWFTNSNFYNSSIELQKPFLFPIFMRIFGMEGMKHFESMDHFNLATLILSNKVINADGKRDRREISHVYKFYKEHFDEEKAKSATYLMNRYYQHPRPSEGVFFSSLLYDLNAYLTKTQKLHIIYYLFELADADGEIAHSELNEVFKICFQINISRKEINQISALYISGYVPFPDKPDDRKYGTKHKFNKTKKKTRKSTRFRSKKRINASSYRLTLSFQILGLNLNASVPQIKAAYRKMVKENHPDKFVSMGAAHVKRATSKMAKINRAYEHIQRVKRFS